MTMPQWQYRTIYLNEIPRGSDAIDVLNDAGGEGWELVGITANNIAYLKRLIAQAGATEPSASSSRRKTSIVTKQTDS
jgi:hypothetical protein